MQVALYSSLSQALIKKNNHLKSTYTNSIFEKFNNLIQIIKNKIESNWFHKKVILILTEDLTDFEDLYIRHTDSFLEYPTLGAITKKIPRSTFERAINKMKANDNRQGAILYYNAYLAENYLNNGKKSKALEIFKQIINDKRSNYDLALKTHIKLLLLQQIKNSNQEYIKLTQEIFSTSPGNLRNYGLKLLVNYDNLSSQIIKKLNKTSFTLDDSNSLNLRYKISYSNSNNEHNFSFIDNNFNSVIIKTSNEDLTKAINMFVNDVFSEVSS